MPIYIYKAATKNGQVVRNRVEEVNRFILLRRLKNNNLLPISVTQINAKGNKALKKQKKNVESSSSILKNIRSKEIEKNMISPIFKGKILSTYFPEKYLCVFEEGQIEKIISIMNLHYDVKKVKNVQQKKKLILDYKNSNESLVKLENYYFVKLIYAKNKF